MIALHPLPSWPASASVVGAAHARLVLAGLLDPSMLASLGWRDAPPKWMQLEAPRGAVGVALVAAVLGLLARGDLTASAADESRAGVVLATRRVPASAAPVEAALLASAREPGPIGRVLEAAVPADAKLWRWLSGAQSLAALSIDELRDALRLTALLAEVYSADGGWEAIVPAVDREVARIVSSRRVEWVRPAR